MIAEIFGLHPPRYLPSLTSSLKIQHCVRFSMSYRCRTMVLCHIISHRMLSCLITKEYVEYDTASMSSFYMAQPLFAINVSPVRQLKLTPNVHNTGLEQCKMNLRSRHQRQCPEGCSRSSSNCFFIPWHSLSTHRS